MEYFDVLTEYGDKTGMRESREEIHSDGSYHGSVHIWYVEDDEVLLQKRSQNKDLCAGKWDAAATGHINAGENPLDAALRELREELKLEVCTDNLKLLFIQKTHIEEGSFVSNEINFVYRLVARIGRDRFVPNKEEISKIAFVTTAQLREMFMQDETQLAFLSAEFERVIKDNTPNPIRSNFHTHTCRCKHASGVEEDYILEAIRNDIPILGFSDHGPFAHWDYGYRMGYNELKVYVGELDRLCHEYEGQICIFKGLEIEYLDSQKGYYPYIVEKYGLDYLALGQHFFEGVCGVENIFNDGTDSGIFVRYAKSIERALKTGYFAFVAHPDIMFLRDFAWNSDAQRAADIIINAAEKYNAVLEFNANGIRRSQQRFTDGVRYPYPHFRFWEQVAKTNIRVLVGSDCHTPEQLYDACMERSVVYADELKLNRIVSIRDIKYITTA